MTITRVAGGGTRLSPASPNACDSDEHLITKWSPALLKMELDRWFWKDRNHMPVKQVWDALCAYCYLPRLCDESVFAASIQAGLASGDYFGCATSVSAQGRYEGLTLGTPATVYVDASSVLVKPEAARAQREAERPPDGDTENETEPSRDETGDDASPDRRIPPQPGSNPSRARRAASSETVQLDPLRTGRDMSVVADEVVQHFNALPGAEVEVSVEIAVTVRDGRERGGPAESSTRTATRSGSGRTDSRKNRAVPTDHRASAKGRASRHDAPGSGPTDAKKDRAVPKRMPTDPGPRQRDAQADTGL